MNDHEVTARLERAEACYRRFCEAVQALRASLAEERTLLQSAERPGEVVDERPAAA
jgi:hypothetical protein